MPEPSSLFLASFLKTQQLRSLPALQPENSRAENISVTDYWLSLREPRCFLHVMQLDVLCPMCRALPHIGRNEFHNHLWKVTLVPVDQSFRWLVQLPQHHGRH